MKKKTKLAPIQIKAMRKHRAHHTKAHMAMMTKLMKQGHSFAKAHSKTMKKIGK